MSRSAARRPRFAGGASYVALLCALSVTLVVTIVASVSVGSVTIPPSQVWASVAAHLGAGAASDGVNDQIVWTVRVPRALLGVLAGAGLAICGVVIQAVVRNSLGDPYLIGIMPGASLGAVIVIVFGAGAVGGLSLSAASFVGAMVVFVVVFLLGQQSGQFPPARLVLAGVAIGYLASAFTFFFQILATPNQVQRVLFWSLGSLGGATWADLPLIAAIVLLGVLVLSVNGQRLNALAAGTDLTASLGVNVVRFQLFLMVMAALVTGAIVAVVGGIGFVGLVIPHIARLLVGADHRRVLVTSALIGGVFLPLADIAARMLRAPAELPIGIVTAAVGAPFFLWLLVAPRRRQPRRKTTAPPVAVPTVSLARPAGASQPAPVSRVLGRRFEP